MNLSRGRRLFVQETQQPDERIDLERVALYIAMEEYPDLDVEVYIHALDSIALEIKKRLPKEFYPLKILKTIQQYLYEELGYSGNRTDYYDPRNSFLNQVIDRRTGIPITLALIYLAIARRIDFPMVGINMPGHFIIRPIAENLEIFVDPFHSGEILFSQDCEELLMKVFDRRVELQPEYLAPVSNRQLLGRLLTNLKVIYVNQRKFTKAAQACERILLLFPDAPSEHRDRGVLYYRSDRLTEARQDFERYLELAPLAEDAQVIQEILDEMPKP
jgi:regulator of sirC expression with transglutaminase-like and TPR domain